MAGAASVVTVTLNPAIDQTISIPGFTAGEVNRVTASRTDAGGKGVNVASFLSDLGIPVVATGFLGRDNTGIFEQLFRGKGMEDGFIRVPGSTRVGIKIFDDHTGQTTDINFPGLEPAPAAVAQLLERVEGLAAAGRWFVLSGSVPAGLNPDIYARLMRVIRGRGGRIALDTSGQPLRCAMECKPDLAKPNVEELQQLVGRELPGPGDVREAALSLQRGGVGLVAISMGARGALFVDGETGLLARPPRVAVKSSVGAGDAMVSGMVYARLKGLGLEECARMATALGAYAVTRYGAGVDAGRVRAYGAEVVLETWEGGSQWPESSR